MGICEQREDMPGDPERRGARQSGQVLRKGALNTLLAQLVLCICYLLCNSPVLRVCVRVNAGVGAMSVLVLMFE